MKFFRMLRRSIRDAFKSVFRNFSLSLASISCITITLIIVAISIIVTFNVQSFTREMEKDLTIVVFLDADTTEDETNDIRERLEKMTNVESLTYQSKAAIKEEMSKESDVFNEVMSTWDDEDNPLKDTFQVKVKDVEKISDTAKKIGRIDKVSTVRYGEGMVDNLISAFEAAQKISYGMVIALILVTVFLIINTIKLTIFSRKREISIMRLVGASNFTIKTPFIVEGMVLGLFGSIIPILIICFGYIALYNHFDGYLYSRMITLIEPEPFIYMVSGIVLVIGIIVGMIGSASAVRKYLKI
ncbi:MAG TPA: ABC transporter permease [Candidatus Onthousia excrementipullorum]|uniref:Cell division protein FtsX n=1 Tax=Candidatus Onthousia excrementipullorum TaxID=2840884 RepID=A0A9D1DVA6_9FIRM|nr:ABC transporter permease [Candidatus Onthousia excrementipullorum]